MTTPTETQSAHSALSFFVAGIPKGQPRAKAFRRGNFTGVYDPGTADEWKLFVRDACSRNWNKTQIIGPVALKLAFRFPRPKGHFRSNGEVKPAAPVVHTSKPDCDNAAKAVMDALTNIGLWRDDSQVCQLEVVKEYSTTAGCMIEVKAL